ncbi:helix-turn-helix transcriptional regulator [Variovorax sp. PCZ-1]|uniref:helix-turn-helix transcriptional regulator n=1 Tax=Variovorax sp. PCZ-1 TaxID=2835533 RepID=UPI001BCD4706|nr:helix-turn-helix transcriptional regulator [Variovorax sp. PCZ-1]MBS7806670.1 helix-turn-helix transcriptional regulator [Variovorax sp. PCZ-1]
MKYLTPELISSLISDIYDCALQPQEWAKTLARVADTMDAAYVSLTLSTPDFQQAIAVAHSPWDAAQLQRLNQDFALDVPGLTQLIQGSLDTPGSSMDMFDEREFQTSRFYREWVQPQGLRDSSVCKFAQTGDRIGIAAAITSASRDLVQPEEHRFMQLLAPHFRRAAMIGDLLNTQSNTQQSYRHLIDVLSSPVILTDRFGKVHQINAAADALLEKAETLELVNGHLRANENAAASSASTHVQHIQSLQQAIEMAALGDATLGHRGIGITLQAPGQTPLIAYVLPLQVSDIRSGFTQAAVAIFLCSRDTATPVTESLLATLYALTPAEIRVFQHLAQGLSAKEIAKTLHLSESTVVTHTRHLLAKTKTHKQTQLMALAAALTPPVAANASRAVQLR